MADGSATQLAPLRFRGSKSLIHRLTLSTLTGRAIHITKIRSNSSTSPGLTPHEVSFCRLLDRLTNGSEIEFSPSGTALLYRPGLISGGTITHSLPTECSTRGASYFLLPICMLAPFAKQPLDVTLTGPGLTITATNATSDISVETVRTAILPIYRRFGIERNIELKVHSRTTLVPGARSAADIPQPAVQLRFGHQVRLPGTLHLLAAGRVKRVRGVAYCVGVSTSNNARMTEAARGVLNPLAPDTYVFSQSYSPKLAEDRANPGRQRRVGLGYGIALVAESAEGCLYSADLTAATQGVVGEHVTPEDVGRRCAFKLLENVERGGCVEEKAVETVLTLMSLGSEDVGRVRLGRRVVGSEKAIALGRDLRAFGCSAWGLRDADEEDGGEGDIVVSVVGRAFGNVGKKVA